MSEKPIKKPQVQPPCRLCRGAGWLENSVTGEVRACWECKANFGKPIDKSLIAGKRWA